MLSRKVPRLAKKSCLVGLKTNMKKVLLISNEILHYRVSVYNYFFKKFGQDNWELIVRANKLQKGNPYPINFDFREMPFAFLRYRDEIKKIKPDAVIFFLHLKDLTFWPLLHWAKIKGIPVIFWTKGANLDAADSRIRHYLFNYVHSLNDALILYSRNETGLLWPRNRGKAFAANNAVNHHDFPEITETKDQIKKEFGIPFDTVVLFTGRMDIGGGRKKVDHLIKIFNEIDEPGLGLVIVGSGMSDDLRKTVNAKNTIYLGEVHDALNIKISKLFKMADVFSIPGHLGLGVNQAFYWGLPVVTEQGLHPPEARYLENNRNGFIVPENDVQELKNKILYLLKNDGVRETFSRNAKNDIMENASIDKMYQGFKDAIEYAYNKRRA
jgi:glycosyltransferase involved in cell wall biosynthesis